MSAASLYTNTVLDHHRAPRNFGALDGHTHAADGINPLCGDSLRIEVRVEDGRIAQVRFRGEACAIAIATASMLSEMAAGKTQDELDRLQTAFTKLVAGQVTRDDLLADLNAMAELSHHVARRKCALLPFSALRAAIDGIPIVTTEESSR